MVYTNGKYKVETLLLNGVTWYGVFDTTSKGMIWATKDKKKAIQQADYYSTIL